MSSTGDFNKIMSDRAIFNDFVYTPLSEALAILEERRKDKKLKKKIDNLLEGRIPEVLNNKKCGILSRHITTPNCETRMFISIAEENNLCPVFFEYLDDKFTSNNSYKHSLGQLKIRKKGLNKKGEYFVENITIVDFNKYNGKKLRDVKTIWLEPLVNFHRKIFETLNCDSKNFCFFDGSDWFKSNGGKATDYYTNFLLLFISHGILFENFLCSKNMEGDFTKNVVLKAIEKVENLTGLKPLIVPLEPIDSETDDFWYHHLLEIKDYIPIK